MERQQVGLSLWGEAVACGGAALAASDQQQTQAHTTWHPQRSWQFATQYSAILPTVGGYFERFATLTIGHRFSATESKGLFIGGPGIGGHLSIRAKVHASGSAAQWHVPAKVNAISIALHW